MYADTEFIIYFLDKISLVQIISPRLIRAINDFPLSYYENFVITRTKSMPSLRNNVLRQGNASSW